MENIFRATGFGIVTLIAGAGALGCTSSSGTTASADGGAGSDGSAGGDAGDPGTVVTGNIFVQQFKSGGSYVYDLNARFTKPPPDGCTTTATGPCTISLCGVPGSGGGGTPGKASNAGPITISAPATSAVLTFMPFGTSGAYGQMTGMSAFFAGGDMVSAVGAGGPDLPAFPMQTVVAPNDITVTAPACTPGCPVLDRTMDYVVTWTGGGAGTVDIDVQSGTATSIVNIVCTFTAAAGTGTVPTALLTQLAKAGDPGITGGVFVTPSNHVTFKVGAVDTTMNLTATGLLAPPFTFK